ncbi:SPW repeat domain-containing protein [Chitinophaga japonensis]|uniref:SPW repeat-containing protein n=1 Tax=Chitinophaga japonensis TaxID=104662 RepID=A0A562TC24_CHIJA|nr:SPW repeat protein [Chitinophaga japonensis]TWI90933.1 SPW repeat-containing protein [Chitinophaga japonensis]
MKFIGTRAHGYIDYIVGVLLIAAPWILGFYRGGAESWVPIILGAVIILYSLMTDYELGMARMISMRTHLTLDVIGGLFLAVSPWLFNYADYIWEPHVIVGILEIGVAIMTRRVPATERERRTGKVATS